MEILRGLIEEKVHLLQYEVVSERTVIVSKACWLTRR